MIGVAALVGCGGLWSAASAVRSSGQPLVSFQSVDGSPFGVAVTRNGRFAFVDLTSGRLLVYSLATGTPRLLRTIGLPDQPAGSSLTANGRLLLIADGHGGAVMVSVSRAERGAGRPVVGILRPPASQEGIAGGAIETASSPDGRYVFVTLEYGNPDGAVAIYDLGHDINPHLGSSGYVGLIPLGQAVVGSALSPNGRYLYVTSELAAGASSVSSDGTLSVIDLRRAEHDWPQSVLETVPAGHQPVRVVVSPSGGTVWVTARADDRLLAFSAERLLTSPATARLVSVKVGSAPVGLALFDRGRRMIVADSDRFVAKNAHAALTIVNTKAALAHRRAIVATARAGGFPRELAIDHTHHAAFITNFTSEQLETLGLSPFR